jgi:anti-sigma B factor antagonist
MMVREADNPNRQIRATVRTQDGMRVLELEGELDLETAPEVDAAIRATFPDTGDPVVLDMSRVGFIDSTGIRTVLEADLRAASPVVFIAPSAAVARVLDLTRLNRRFMVVPPGASLTTLRSD